MGSKETGKETKMQSMMNLGKGEMVNHEDSGYFDGQQSAHQTTFDQTKDLFVHSYGELQGTCDKPLHRVNYFPSLENAATQSLSSISSNCLKSMCTTTGVEGNESHSEFHGCLTHSRDSTCETEHCAPDSVSVLDTKSSFWKIKDLHVSFTHNSGVTDSFPCTPDSENPCDTPTSEEHHCKEDMRGISHHIVEKNLLNTKDSGCDSSGTKITNILRQSDIAHLLQTENCVLQSNDPHRKYMVTEEGVCFSVHSSTPRALKFNRQQDSSFYSPIFCKNICNECVDFIGEFQKRSCTDVLKNLLSFFSPKDICTISCVSQQWRLAVSQDQAANQKKENYVKYRREMLTGPDKENLKCAKRCRVDTSRDAFVDKKNTFLRNADSSQNVYSRTSSTPISKFQHFLEKAKNLGIGERIEKCPRCGSPCKVSVHENKGKCSKPSCNCEFCIKCFGCHESSKCPAVISGKTPTTPMVSSKRSKRNLKRL